MPHGLDVLGRCVQLLVVIYLAYKLEGVLFLIEFGLGLAGTHKVIISIKNKRQSTQLTVNS